VLFLSRTASSSGKKKKVSYVKYRSDYDALLLEIFSIRCIFIGIQGKIMYDFAVWHL
jgi:hypothetical protein